MATLASSPAFADDFDLKSAPGSWSGIYAGVHGGYAWGDASGAYDFGPFNDVLFEDVNLSRNLSDDLEGYLVGGQIGVQRQFGNFVLGIEGTASATGIDGSAGADWGFDDIGCGFFGCFGLAAEGRQTLSVEVDDLLTISGRLGYAHGDWLAYVKGGYASADINVKSSITGEGIGCFFACVFPFTVDATGESDKRHDGYVIGGGIEKKIHSNVSLGLEYNYIDLGSETHRINAPLNVSNFVEIDGAHKVRIDPDEIHSVTLRLNLHLNEPDRPAEPLK